MAFGESIFRKSDEFVKNLAGGCMIDALRERTFPKLGPETDHRLARSFTSHGATELVRLTGAETRQRHGHAENLLLVEDDTERFPQDRFQKGVVIDRRGGESTPSQLSMLDIGVDGAADDRTRSHDRHLYDKIFEAAGLGAQQS